MEQVFTTDTVQDSERFAFWREVICAVYVQLEAEPLNSRPFDGSVRVGRWDDVSISEVVAGAQLVRHAENKPRDDCLVSLQTRGTGVISQAGRDAVIGPGDFALYDATRPYELRFDDEFEQIVVQFPRRHLQDRGIDLEQAVATRYARGDGTNDLVSSVLRTLTSSGDAVPTWVRSRVAAQVVDCLSTAVSLETVERAGSSRTLRRRHALDLVQKRLSDPSLTVSAVASELGCSTRSLQQLFADGPTVQTLIRRLRLRKAYDALLHPRNATLTVSRIGADCGYGDPASFARAFRREFGLSPSEARADGKQLG